MSTGGNLINKFERKIEKITGVKYAIVQLWHICTSYKYKIIWHISGDEIIAPTLTFVATINTIIYNECNQYLWIGVNITI